MIAVIADDFTGAAEIGGVGLRNGLRVVIDSKVDCRVETDILVIATDTRSLSPEQATGVIEKVTYGLLAMQPDFIYKKTDSLLRGNVGDELLTQARISRKERILLVPANPALKRIIREGIYYYDGVPLNEVSFTDGPAEKRSSSRVLDLIGGKARALAAVRSPGERLPQRGLVIGNASNEADLDRWAATIDPATTPSGGSGFFDAILRSRRPSESRKQAPVQLGQRALYVCGSAFVNSRRLVRAAREAGQAVAYMPENLFCPKAGEEALTAGWTGEIVRGLDSGKKVIVAVDRLSCDEAENLPVRIGGALANVIEKVLHRTRVDELFIEGGSTSFSVIQRLGYTRFYPTQELGPGTIRMRIEEEEAMHLTLKPGSYAWPASIWEYPLNHVQK